MLGVKRMEWMDGERRINVSFAVLFWRTETLYFGPMAES